MPSTPLFWHSLLHITVEEGFGHKYCVGFAWQYEFVRELPHICEKAPHAGRHNALFLVTVATLPSAVAARRNHVVQASAGTVYPVGVVRAERSVAGYEGLVASKGC